MSLSISLEDKRYWGQKALAEEMINPKSYARIGKSKSRKQAQIYDTKREAAESRGRFNREVQAIRNRMLKHNPVTVDNLASRENTAQQQMHMIRGKVSGSSEISNIPWKEKIELSKQHVIHVWSCFGKHKEKFKSFCPFIVDRQYISLWVFNVGSTHSHTVMMLPTRRHRMHRSLVIRYRWVTSWFDWHYVQRVSSYRHKVTSTSVLHWWWGLPLVWICNTKGCVSIRHP